MKRITILGAGSWGTALALILARNGHEVEIVGRDGESLQSFRDHRENLKYLPGFILPSSVKINDFDHYDRSSDFVVVAVPSPTVEDLLGYICDHDVAVIASKGLAAKGSGLLSELIEGECPGTKCAVISGPNLALELAQGVPTAAVVAGDDQDVAEMVRVAFMNATYRVYRTPDVRGVELAGALKNVVAICAGASDGLGYGDNTKGALVARGLNEMARLGMAMGAELETFLGIAGVGDLFATGSSKLSRNYRVGYALGQGMTLERAIDALGGQVAEGINTCEFALILARKHDVHLPIFEELHAVIMGRRKVREAVVRIMERTAPDERLAKRR